jgi:kojibiose phosphorylase
LFEQFEGFHQLEEVDWSLYQDRKSSMHEALGVEEINHYKVIKQADVIMLLCLLRGEYNREIWEANWNYYAPLTDHTYGSSLGPAMHAWAACEIGQPDVAYEHFIRAARADLKDVRGNVADGIHAASAGGLWQAAIFGFAGLRLTGDGPEVNPRLPDHWRRLKFNVNYYDQTHRFDIKN